MNGKKTAGGAWQKYEDVGEADEAGAQGRLANLKRRGDREKERQAGQPREGTQRCERPDGGETREPPSGPSRGQIWIAPTLVCRHNPTAGRVEAMCGWWERPNGLGLQSL